MDNNSDMHGMAESKSKAEEERKRERRRGEGVEDKLNMTWGD